jgi:CheY-like chemotaxis protein
MMPGSGGLSLIGEVRRNFPEMLILGISGSPEDSVKNECLASGANRFEAKPIPIRRMLQLVAEMLPSGQ